MYKEIKNLQHISCPLCSLKEYKLVKEIHVWKIVKCKGCGFCYTNPRPSKEEVASQYVTLEYNKNRRYIEERIVQHEESYLRRFFYNRKLDLIEQNHRKGRILDFGCGAGLFLDIANERGWETYGIDPAPWVKEMAKKKGFKAYIGFIQDLNLPSSYFDVVFSSATLEHLSDPLGDLKEIDRVLKENGLFLATSIPNFDSLTIKLGLPDFRYDSPPKHLNYFTLRTLKKMLRIAGFKEIQGYTYGFDYQGTINKVMETIPRGYHRTKKGSSVRKTFEQYLAKKIVNLFLTSWNYGDKLEVLCRK